MSRAVGRWNTLRGGVLEDPRRLSQLLLAVNLNDTLQSWSRVQPRGYSFIYYATRLFFPFEYFFDLSSLVKLLFLLSMKTNILLLTGMCDHNIQLIKSTLII